MKTSKFQIGHYSTLARAEKKMMDFVGYDKDVEPKYRDTYCYIISEWKIDMCCNDFVSIRTYMPDGSFYEENMADKNRKFWGRPADTIRFKKGDIVEVYDWDMVSLGIIDAVPFTPEEVKVVKERSIKYMIKKQGCSEEEARKFGGIWLDDSDDTYRLYTSEDTCHTHVESQYVFPVRKKVSDRLKKILQYNLEHGD